MFLSISLTFYYINNMFFFSFFFVFLFVENYRTNIFLINFDKKQSFFNIPKILFLLVFFLFVHIFLTMITGTLYV